jgi:hypothetical protein
VNAIGVIKPYIRDDNANEANYAEWTLHMAEAGIFRVEVFTDGAYAQSEQAEYWLRHDGVVEAITIDQTVISGWQSLGDFAFTAGGDQWLHLGDNTGEPSSTDTQLVFDAVQLTRLNAPPVDDGGLEPDGGGAEADASGSPADGGDLRSGCDAGGVGAMTTAGCAFAFVELLALTTRRIGADGYADSNEVRDLKQ